MRYAAVQLAKQRRWMTSVERRNQDGKTEENFNTKLA